jgi:2-dehydro-3-deoxyphosphogluconate aldolase/(4S)-4-hydroxy-2-oxoglutarate aldolase
MAQCLTPMNIRDIVALAPVIPELMLTELAHALPVARALCAGGLRVLEVSVRTPNAHACIEAIRKGLPDAIVGAGGLTRAVEFAAADRAGAQFGTTPGLTPELAAASRGARFPVMPGIMTPTELIIARNLSFTVLKLFPAELAGGVAILRAFGLAFPDVLFCASGGITSANASSYLALANVRCVAGSWLVPPDKLAAGDWAGIEALARQGASLAISYERKS